MMFFMIALSLYSENESQWFNSYVVNISSVAGTEYANTYMAFMVSASALVGTIAFIIWGCISDNSTSKYGRRKPILVIGSITTGILVFTFGLTTNYWWLLICDGLLIAITSNMFHVTNRALIPDIWPTERRGRVNTYMFVGSTLGTAFVWGIALLIKFILQEEFSRELHMIMFGIVTITLTIASIFVWFGIREPPVPPTVVQRPWIKSFKDLFNRQEMGKYPEFLKLFVASLFVVMAGNAFKPFILILVQSMELSEISFLPLILLALLTVGSIVYLLFNGLDKIGRKKVTVIALIGTIIGGMVLGLSNGEMQIILYGLVIMVPFLTGLEIAVSTWTQDLLPEGERGKFLGIINIGKAAGQVPGVMLAGLVADFFGIYSVFFITVAFLLMGIAAFQFVPESLRKKVSS